MEADDVPGVIPESSNKCGQASVWEDKPRPLKEILSSTRLPCTLKLHQGDLSKCLPNWPEHADVVRVTDLRRCQIVIGREMEWDKGTNDYVPTGEQLEIPALYKGKQWFISSSKIK